ncbi:MAG: NAD-dependent deacylase [Nitrospirae bacterium]|nr:NAD-dependent deacylase [Nitrospirota bacterium]
MSSPIEQVRERLSSACRVTVLTGAGISADSGIPTFRGPDGLWKNFRAEDLATPEAFTRDPALVWEWYNWRRELLATKEPNPAHRALVSIEGKMETRRAQFHLLTQNVDGLHGLAGSRNLIELHGNIWEVRCTGCGAVTEDRRVPIPIPPYCSSCGKMLRPHIVWFGEMLDSDDVSRALESLEHCDMMLVIGTSGVVQPAASFASTARSAGAFVVEINPDASSGAAHVALRGRAAEIVPLLV